MSVTGHIGSFILHSRDRVSILRATGAYLIFLRRDQQRRRADLRVSSRVLEWWFRKCHLVLRDGVWAHDLSFYIVLQQLYICMYNRSIGFIILFVVLSILSLSLPLWFRSNFKGNAWFCGERRERACAVFVSRDLCCNLLINTPTRLHGIMLIDIKYACHVYKRAYITRSLWRYRRTSSSNAITLNLYNAVHIANIVYYKYEIDHESFWWILVYSCIKNNL